MHQSSSDIDLTAERNQLMQEKRMFYEQLVAFEEKKRALADVEFHLNKEVFWCPIFTDEVFFINDCPWGFKLNSSLEAQNICCFVNGELCTGCCCGLFAANCARNDQVSYDTSVWRSCRWCSSSIISTTNASFDSSEGQHETYVSLFQFTVTLFWYLENSLLPKHGALSCI